MLEHMRAMAGLAATLVLLTATGAFAQPKPAPKPAAKPAIPAKPAVPVGPKTLAETLTGDAKVDYDAGRSLFGDADYGAAAVKFQSAFDKSNDPRLLWNVAGCERNDHHYARALKLVQQYLDSGGALLTDQDRADAKEFLAAIAQFTIQLTIVVNEPGAEISVDDVVLGKSPLAQPETVDIGLRRIVVKKPGFKDYASSQRFDGKSATVDVKLDREVHTGELRVTTTANAHVFIDGTEVGVGSFKGTIASGGHTLRVTAPGMQSYQSEVVVTDDEKRTIDVQLIAEVDLTKVVPTKKEPVYRGFYGKFSTAALFGSGGGYDPPSGYTATGSRFGFVAKLSLGYTFGWFGIEAVQSVMFSGQAKTTSDGAGKEVFFTNYQALSGFVGVGVRATSKHPVARVTTGVALGFGPHETIGSLTLSTCNQNNGGSPGCSNQNDLAHPGYTSAALSGDVGLLLGGSGKFWIGVDWYVDFAPDITIGPATDPQIQAFLVNQGATIIHGPQFFIGPVLGVGFGH